jgi:protein-L-isoaspartate(D-aspartate) O-methyltransferase
LDVTSAERFPMAGGLRLQPRQSVPRGQLTGQAQAWYQDLQEDRLNALRSFAGRRVFLKRPTGRILSLRSSGRREAWTDGSTIMKTLLLVLSMVAGARDATAQEDAQCVRERAAMVETIKDYARSRAVVSGQQGFSERVLEAMGQTKRHLFIPERSCSIAYADMPLPIGRGQTISQPFIVALMTELAEAAPDHVVLEVGTGSGYQAAILAHLARKVCTIEIIPALAEAATKTLRDLAYDNVSVRLGDGYAGWPECGPFDAIVVTAALGEIPPPLIEQLKVGGRLVMPVGSAYTTQQLTVVEKIAPDRTTTRAVALVRFVPFTRSKN